MSFDPTKYTKSRFIKGADLEDGPIVVTIAQALEHDFDNGTKPVLEFSDHDQGVVLNKTNTQTMIKLFGEDVEAWVGQRIMLTERPNAYQGQSGINIQRVAKPKAKAKPVEVAEIEDAEEIPF